MWIIMLIVLGMISGCYMAVTGNHPTVKTLRHIPALKSVEARIQGQRDMRKAVESAIVHEDYRASRQAIEDEHAQRMKARYSSQDDYSHYSRHADVGSAMSKNEALEALEMKYKRARRRIGTLDADTVASFMVKWETSTGEPFPFDPAKGQTSEYYFGADSKVYDAYIQGGMEYLNGLGTTKHVVIDRTNTVNGRKTIQAEVNRQYRAATEAQHMLQLESMIDAKEKFEADMQKIADSSKMIEG